MQPLDMKETVPVLLGVLLAVACEMVPGRTARRVTWAAASVVAGVAATVLTGEAAISWAFVLIDVPIVALTAVVTRFGLLYLARRYPTGPLRRYVRGERPARA